jgi:hypothetical protein
MENLELNVLNFSAKTSSDGTTAAADRGSANRK